VLPESRPVFSRYVKAVLKKRGFHGIVVADSTMREWRRARVGFWPLEARF
jgi:hypothetical protein